MPLLWVASGECWRCLGSRCWHELLLSERCERNSEAEFRRGKQAIARCSHDVCNALLVLSTV